MVLPHKQNRHSFDLKHAWLGVARGRHVDVIVTQSKTQKRSWKLHCVTNVALEMNDEDNHKVVVQEGQRQTWMVCLNDFPPKPSQ